MSGSSSVVTYFVRGFDTCPYFARAAGVVRDAAKAHSDSVAADVKGGTRDEYHVLRASILKNTLGKDADSHKTCPLVYSVGADGKASYIGGCDATVALFSKLFPSG